MSVSENASPGRLDELSPLCGREHHCITCSDDGIPMDVLLVDGRRGLALCSDAAGTRSSVETELVGVVSAGDVLLVHAGTAIARLQRGDES